MTDVALRVLGGLILAVIFGGVFISMSRSEGWRVAAAIWAGSITATLIIMGALFLLLGGAS